MPTQIIPAVPGPESGSPKVRERVAEIGAEVDMLRASLSESQAREPMLQKESGEVSVGSQPVAEVLFDSSETE